jgi:hypothetical protein
VAAWENGERQGTGSGGAGDLGPAFLGAGALQRREDGGMLRQPGVVLALHAGLARLMVDSASIR